MLVLYSDGVTEAENHKGQPFEESGLERVVDALRAGQPARPRARPSSAAWKRTPRKRTSPTT